LCTSSFLDSWCAIRLLRENKVGTRDGQTQATSAAMSADGDSFLPSHSLNRKPSKRERERAARSEPELKRSKRQA